MIIIDYRVNIYLGMFLSQGWVLWASAVNGAKGKRGFGGRLEWISGLGLILIDVSPNASIKRDGQLKTSFVQFQRHS